jgi:hypothetical protein
MLKSKTGGLLSGIDIDGQSATVPVTVVAKTLSRTTSCFLSERFWGRQSHKS